MKKLLLLTPLYPPAVGGPATHTIFAEQELSKRGFDITRVNFGDFLIYPYIIRHILFFCALIPRAWRTDIIYALDPLGVGVPAALLALVFRRHFVVRIAGDRAWETGVQKFGVTEPLDEFAGEKFYSLPLVPLKDGQLFTARVAHRIVVPSHYMKRIVTAWGVSATKIEVVSSSYQAQEVPNRQTLREELGIKGLSIVSSGRLVPWKGFQALIELMPEILALRGDATLTILGDGPERYKLEEIVHLLRLEDVVKFTGNVSKQEVLSHVRAADLFVLNTGYEGLSHQLLEVMDMGTPIVTTRIGGNPELIENGEEGILVEYNNRSELLTAIKEMMENPIRARLFTENARQKLRNFDPEVIADQLAQVL